MRAIEDPKRKKFIPNLGNRSRPIDRPYDIPKSD